MYDRELSVRANPGKARVMLDPDMFYVKPTDIDVAIAKRSHSNALQICPKRLSFPGYCLKVMSPKM